MEAAYGGSENMKWSKLWLTPFWVLRYQNHSVKFMCIQDSYGYFRSKFTCS